MLMPIGFMQYSPVLSFVLFKFIVVMEIGVQAFDLSHHKNVIYENIACATV